MMQGSNVTYKIAGAEASRGLFVRTGVIDDQDEINFRPISDDFAVFGISRDLGTIQTTQAPVVWSVGYTTDPAVNYTDLSGAPPASRRLYYKTQYSTDEALASIDSISWEDDVSNIIVQIADFLIDFSNASSRAQQLDNKILQDAASVSNLLGDLVSLSIAQVYGSTQLTIGTDALGNFNNSDVMMFMKNIGGVEAK